MSWIEEVGMEMFGEFNMTELLIDQAYMNVSSSTFVDIPLWLYELSSNCFKCPFTLLGELNPNRSVINKFTVSTTYPATYRLRTEGSPHFVLQSNDSAKFCDVEMNLGEFGVYNLQAFGSRGSPRCESTVELEPVNIYLPLLLAFFFYIFLGILVFAVSRNKEKILELLGSQKFGSRKNLMSSPSGSSGGGCGGGGEPYVQRRSIPSALPGPDDPGHSDFMSASALSNSIQRAENDYNGGGGGGGGKLTKKGSADSSTSGSSKGSNGKPPATAPRPISSQTILPVTTPGGGPSRALQLNLQPQPTPLQGPQKLVKTNKRLRSLDTFRGICIVVMIFVNDGGAGYYFFKHATWDGLDFADLVFPWFLWIMGVCIPVSIKSQVKRGNSRLKIFQRILIRSLKLIGLGIVLSSGWGPINPKTFRLPGVLHRFGICYFVASTLVLLSMTVNITKPDTSKFKAALQDIGIVWISWIIVLIFVAVHSLLTFMLEIPGCPTGYLGPGGLHLYEEMIKNETGLGDFEALKECIGGAAGYIDRQVFTLKHIYQYPTAGVQYNSIAYDPEGLLGTLTAILNVWLGVQAGATMLVYPRASSRLKRWMGWAIITGALGALLCGGKQTDGWIPVNKNLWSLSFVLVTTCFALSLLSFLYIVIDIKKWWSGSPFYEPGMNSILLYAGHSIASRYLPWHWFSESMRFRHFPKLVESLWGTTLWVIIALWLHFKQIFWVL